MPIFPTNVPGCTSGVSSHLEGVTATADSGTVVVLLNQACTGDFNVSAYYALRDGAFRKDFLILWTGSRSLSDVEISLLNSPSDCDGYLYIPFVNQAPKTGIETNPSDRIVPVTDTGVTGFPSSYLVVPDSIGGLTGQGGLGWPTRLTLQWATSE